MLMIRMMFLIIGKAPGVLSYVEEIAEIGLGALGVVETPSKVNAGGFQLATYLCHIPSIKLTSNFCWLSTT